MELIKHKYFSIHQKTAVPYQSLSGFILNLELLIVTNSSDIDIKAHMDFFTCFFSIFDFCPYKLMYSVLN